MNCRYLQIAAAVTLALASAAQARAVEADDTQTPLSGATEDDTPSVPKTAEPEPVWQVNPRWRLQYEIANLDGPVGLAGLGKVEDIRRAQLGIDLQMPGGFSARVEGEFSADPIEFVDAYVAWTDKNITVAAGQHKPFTPLDDMTSDLNTSFLERASIVTAFGYGRRTGISAGFAKGDFAINGGLFTDPLMMLNDVRKGSISGDFRGYWSPSVGEAKLHFGVAYHYRDMKDFAFVATRYQLQPQTRIADMRYISTPPLFVSSEQRYGLEAAGVLGRFHGAAEAHWLKASRTGLSDPTYFGGYAEAGVFLTNDSRPLDGGLFGAMKPTTPLGGGGIGAVQINVRYDYLDLNDAGVTGGTQDGYLASLIWTPVDYLRFIVQYSKLIYDDAAIAAAGDRTYSVDVLGLRGQLSF